MDVFSQVEFRERRQECKANYDLLQCVLAEQSFVSFLLLGGMKKKLPRGVYRSDSDESLSTLRGRVMAAAAKTGCDSCGLIWRGGEMLTWCLDDIWAAHSTQRSTQAAEEALGSDMLLQSLAVRTRNLSHMPSRPSCLPDKGKLQTSRA